MKRALKSLSHAPILRVDLHKCCGFSRLSWISFKSCLVTFKGHQENGWNIKLSCVRIFLSICIATFTPASSTCVQEAASNEKST